MILRMLILLFYPSDAGSTRAINRKVLRHDAEWRSALGDELRHSFVVRPSQSERLIYFENVWPYNHQISQ